MDNGRHAQLTSDGIHTAKSSPNWARWWIASGSVSLILVMIAFRCAWLATNDLDWPYDYDLYRDAALAQSIMAGHFPADPYYSGEQNWYNPLSPAIVSVVARLTGLPPARVYAREGAVVGLAIAFAILALAVVLFGRWPGVASLFAFLFLGPTHVPNWAAPSYSPWLFPNVVSLVPFALTLIAAFRARETGSLRAWAIAGILLGVTFLAHTATAIVAGCVLLYLSSEPRKWRAVGWRWGVILVSAFVASTPLLVSILWHYGLHIRNSAPVEFGWSENDLMRLPELLKGSLNLRNASAVAGFVLLWTNQNMVAAHRAFVSWMAVCVLMIAYGYARQLWPTANLPGLVPGFHWLFHLRCAGLLLCGYGIYRGAVFVAGLVARLPKVPVAAVLVAGSVAVPFFRLLLHLRRSLSLFLGGVVALALCLPSRKLSVPATLAGLLGILLLFQYPYFAERYDFVVARKMALDVAAKPGFSGTSEWLRRSTPSDAVILAAPLDAIRLVGSAGRKTVVVDAAFSNPYVSYEPRAAAAAALFESLANHEHDLFRAGATKYRVTYVLLGPDSAPIADRCVAAPFVTKVFSEGVYTILRVKL